MFVWLIDRARARVPCAIHAIALMTNHVHLLVTPPDAQALPAFVKRFAQRYAMFRNRERDASGKLFEERYKSSVVADHEQLAVTTAYIDRNPVEANMVADPLDYPWSTYAIHLSRAAQGRIGAHLWTPSAWYTGLGDTPAARAEAYKIWFNFYHETRLAPKGMDEMDDRIEATPYTLRLERPDRSSAAEPSFAYGMGHS